MSLKLVPCRYFKQGQCSYGANCQYSHELNAKGTPPCVYFLKGHCAKGDKCTFRHEKPAEKKKPAPKPLIRPRLAPEKKKPPPKNDILEFTPGATQHGLTLAEKLSGDTMGDISAKRREKVDKEVVELVESKLCPYLIEKGTCKMEPCPFIHGAQCDTCGLHVLITGHVKQNEAHRTECAAAFEADMETAFKQTEAERLHNSRLETSRGKLCGICMEEVIALEPASERRFSIFQNCAHVFCLKCIRNWRSTNAYEKDLVRSCPVCRTLSHFIIPSQYWIELPEEKSKLIEDYKDNLARKDCRHFNFGEGECPFSTSCFYRHQYADGTLQDRTKIDPRQTRREHQWDSGVFAELAGQLEGDEAIDLVNMFQRLATHARFNTTPATDNTANEDGNWEAATAWTASSGNGTFAFTGDDVDAEMLRDEILDEIGFEYSQGGYYQNNVSDEDDITDDDFDVYDEMP